MTKSNFLRRAVLCVLLILLGCSAWRVRAKDWNYDFKEALDSDETKKETITPGDSVSIENSGSRDLQYNPSSSTEVLKVEKGDHCKDEAVQLANLFTGGDAAPVWKVTGSTRSLTIPVGSVREKETIPFCFKVTDTEKKKTLTAVIKVAGAHGLSAAVGVSIGIPALAFVLISM
ncbi:UNVERIFIED_CONTAM: SAG-related sequence SRS35A [Hammondia hammondi]|eukprot:XP_008885946.1 SAG-related sequence SRS35A [Hammondia hammondi]